jgi:hypothetical protein
MSGRKRTSQAQSSGAEVELRADGWERFKSAVRAAAKSGPKHRPSKLKPKELEAKKSNK